MFLFIIYTTIRGGRLRKKVGGIGEKGGKEGKRKAGRRQKGREGERKAERRGKREEGDVKIKGRKGKTKGYKEKSERGRCKA